MHFTNLGLPGSPVGKNLLQCGDTGLIPGPGRSHMLKNNLTPWATATEAHIARAQPPATTGATRL